MVETVKRISKSTVRKIENAYAVFFMLCTALAIAKLATQPKVHSSLGQVPVWQVIAGVLFGGLAYTLWRLVENSEKQGE